MNISFYFILFLDRPAKLYLDIEFCRLSNQNKDGEVAVNTFLKVNNSSKCFIICSTLLNITPIFTIFS